MFFSSWPPETNEQLLAEAGLVLSLDELVTMREPEASVTFQWVLARRRETLVRSAAAALVPLRRWAAPDEIARAVVFLASDLIRRSSARRRRRDPAP